ncbi:MAG: NAD-dependent epimerase/dehydratase family protein [Pseudomonadota bacterium]
MTAGPRKIVITGAAGLLGWHAATRLHALICAARYRGETPPVAMTALDRAAFNDPGTLADALQGAHGVLHFAGVNRANPDDLEAMNPAIAETLTAGCRAAGVTPHIVYANTIHAGADTPYGRSKAKAGTILAALGGPYTDLVLPHIFGEAARPHYNNVTATLIAALLQGETPEINPAGAVRLLHAGAAAQAAVDAVLTGQTGRLEPAPRPIAVPTLWAKLQTMHQTYQGAVYPDLADPFDRDLFNSYRAATYPGHGAHWPRPLTRNTDPRGTLFEAVKGGSAGQVFASWSEPGVTRGEHFHLHKVERFLVLQGQATIRIRKVLTGAVWEYPVTGDSPQVVDMPTLHTHSLENTGDAPMLAVFWTHDIFDPGNPDTYADPVRGGQG